MTPFSAVPEAAAPDTLLPITPARAEDLAAVEELLRENSLPLVGLYAALATALVARREGRVVGAVALELYGRSALLRSLAVRAEERGRGLGRALTQAALGLARAHHVERVFLLTETARDFFAALGFRAVERGDVPAAVHASVEFRAACPASAVAMERVLGGPAAEPEPGARGCCTDSCCGGGEHAAAAPSTLLSAEALAAAVRERYDRLAVEGGSCCGPAPCGSAAAAPVALGVGYSQEDLAALPDGANLGLGCGAPLQFLALQAGEVVLDLGSGAGVDALLAARRVGPAGRVIGVDMTPAMLDRARENALAAGLGNVEFRAGRLEALPLADRSVDAVTSNCVINLVPDKARVFAEIARVLRPGGRMVISDILLEAPLPPALAQDLLAYVGCVAGALQREPYFDRVRRAGLARLEVLRDVDYLTAVGDHLPAEVATLAQRAGVRAADLAGTVRSVTFRAWRP